MAKPLLQLNIHIPAFGPRPGAGLLQAYTAALCREIESSREDISAYEIASLYLWDASALGEGELKTLLFALGKNLDLGGAERTVELSPERLSTAKLTWFRNFHTDLYRLDMGSLNVVDFSRLNRPYAYGCYAALGRLLGAYELHNFCALLNYGIPGESLASLEDSLNRALALEPDGVCISPLGGEPGPAAGESAAFARRRLLAQGYERSSLNEYAKPGRASRRIRLLGEGTDFWGLGLGAVSYLEGCVLKNRGDMDGYIAHAGDPEALIAQAVRPDGESLMANHALRGLQSADGLALDPFAARFGPTLEPVFSALTGEGLAEAREGRLVLTDLGAAQIRQVRSYFSFGKEK